MIYKYIRPIFFKLPEEFSHNIVKLIIKYNCLTNKKLYNNKKLNTKISSINFKNPIGLAAGFDKNADMIRGLSNQGFSAIELGTVTPKAQLGNPKPRIFRLSNQQAIINRLGFNNKGMAHFIKSLQIYKANLKNSSTPIIGANIGRNKNSKNNASDYLFLLKHLYRLCDYITINISSPNTPNLRKIHISNNLSEFLKEISESRKSLAMKYDHFLPLFLKIAPDISENEQENIIELVLKYKIDALIIGNTTIQRPKNIEKEDNYKENGGLSGAPLFAISNKIIQNIYKLSNGKIPIIASGGVSSAEDAYKKIKLGASFVQIYTAIIYHGFGLISKINQELLNLLEQDNFNSITEAIGADCRK